MPKILNLDEMLDVLREVGPQHHKRFRAELESIGTGMAVVIAERLNLDHDGAVSEGVAFAGTCACFYAKDREQAEPDGLLGFDPGGEWETRNG